MLFHTLFKQLLLLSVISYEFYIHLFSWGDVQSDILRNNAYKISYLQKRKVNNTLKCTVQSSEW